MKKAILAILMLGLGGRICSGQTVRVGLEYFPPLIIDKERGYTVLMLKEIEKNSDLQFDISIMTYARAKAELKAKRVDLIGHTPLAQEVPEFYSYAVELDWSILTKLDLFSKTSEFVYPDEFKTLKSIGVPIGNKDFFAGLLGIAPGKIKEYTDLTRMVRLLGMGRLEGVVFERASIMRTIEKHKIEGIHYRMAMPNLLPAGLAVQNSAAGSVLREKLDALLAKLNTQKYFGGYLKYLSLPDRGVVSVGR